MKLSVEENMHNKHISIVSSRGMLVKRLKTSKLAMTVYSGGEWKFFNLNVAVAWQCVFAAMLLQLLSASFLLQTTKWRQSGGTAAGIGTR